MTSMNLVEIVSINGLWRRWRGHESWSAATAVVEEKEKRTEEGRRMRLKRKGPFGNFQHD